MDKAARDGRATGAEVTRAAASEAQHAEPRIRAPHLPVPAGQRPLNVLHTVRSLRVNGITNVVLRTIAELDPRRVQSHLCSIYDHDYLAFALRDHGVEPVFLGHRGPRSMMSTVLRIARLIRERNIDLVHANQVIDLVLAGAAARLCGVPVVVTLHWTAEAQPGAEHAGLRERAWDSASSMGRHVVRGVSDHWLADRIIAVSDAVATSHAELLGSWFPLSKVDVIYPGLDFSDVSTLSADDRERLRRDVGVEGASHVLLNIGRLDPVKGQKYLVPMMQIVRQRYPGAKLLIAGDGQLRDALAAQIEEYALTESIIMLGWRLDISALLSIADVLVVASETEAAPLPLLEAARQSKPVVATRVGGIPEILSDGVNGYSVPRGDPAAMAGAVLRLLDHPDRAQEMGEAGRRMAENRFGIGRSVRLLEEIYVETTAPRRHGTVTRPV